MMSWLKMHLAQGKVQGTQILSEAVFNEMHAPQIVAEDTLTEIARQETFNRLYAMGWWTVT